jgi:hypothetical protein
MSLRTALESPLTYLSWFARHAFSILAVVLAGRAVWLGVVAVTPSSPGSLRNRSERPRVPSDDAKSLMPDRPDLKAIDALAGLDKAIAQRSSKEPEVMLRSIVVDFGPPRSEVFLNGRLVGQSPFAGQVSCRDGDVVHVAVLPPHGAPILRDMRCMKNEPVESSQEADALGRSAGSKAVSGGTEEQKLLEERAKQRLDKLIEQQQKSAPLE